MRHRSIIVLTLGVILATATAAQAAVPSQVAYNAAKYPHGGPFVHGDDMSVVITRRYSTGWPTQINTDCAGALAKYGRLPGYAVERYGRKSIETSTCASPLEFRSLPLVGPATRKVYFRRKVRGIQWACRSLHKTGLRGKRGRDRAHVPCSHVKALDANKGRAVLQYRARTSKSVKTVALASDGRMVITYRNGFTRTYYNRVM